MNHRADAARNLAIYLNDHWAGSAAGQELSRHLVARNREWAPELVALAAEIRQERQTLRALKSTLGIGGGRFKGLGSVVFAYLGRLKTNASGYSALSRLDELEALLAGVSFKRGLWVSLQACAAAKPELARFDLSGLEQQAARQAKTLRKLQERAAVEAFQ
ncbi:MAG: hypothetical protein ABR609_00470 [Acidimicrobiia bacterium]